MKYDKVVEMNQTIGKENARIVEKEIKRMIENGERITVAALQRYTGFSNSFFYKNKLVREILYEAVRKQEQCYKNNFNAVRTQQETEEIIGVRFIVVLIALLLIFKEQLISLITTIFEKVTSESSGI